MLRLYYADISELTDEADRYPLSEYRLNRLEHLRPQKNRQQGIGAELLLLHAVKEVKPETPVPLCLRESAGGKPFFSDSNIHFSLSHSGAVAACAIADREIGLDIQLQAQVNMRLVRRFFTAGEEAFLERSDDPDRDFTMLWALKESYLKAIGTGLRTPLNQFDMIIGDPIRAKGVQAAFWYHQIGDLHFALCVPGADIAEPDLIQEIKMSRDFTESVR